jgi:lipid-binding SYLF domain-containing protein
MTAFRRMIQSNNYKFMLSMLLALLFVTSNVSYVSADTAEEIETSVNISLDQFHSKVKGAAEFSKTAKGLLVMPNVMKAGLFFGAEYGEGAFRVDGKTAGYYNIIGGSFGLQFGFQKKDIIIAFMTVDAIDEFQQSPGWEIGVDGNIALVNVGAGQRIDTTTLRNPVVAFVFDVRGLMADISLKGAKFTRLDK